jgi:flagellar biosynthetic protein FliR
MNVQLSSDELSVFLLILARSSGLVVTAPVIGDAQVPRMIKVGLVIMLSLVLVQVPGIRRLDAPVGLYAFSLSVVTQLIVGMSLGLAARMMFFAVQTAGGIVSLQIGLSVASVLNPMTRETDALMSQLYTVIVGMLFLAMNGDLWLVASLTRSFDLAPLTPSALSPHLVQSIIGDFLLVTQLGVQIAMPIAASLFATDLVLGVISRALPQLNIFVLSLPLNILLGFMALSASLAGMTLIVSHLTDQVPNIMLDLVRHA